MPRGVRPGEPRPANDVASGGKHNWRPEAVAFDGKAVVVDSPGYLIGPSWRAILVLAAAIGPCVPGGVSGR
jgi:hypothetical protein